VHFRLIVPKGASANLQLTRVTLLKARCNYLKIDLKPKEKKLRFSAADQLHIFSTVTVSMAKSTSPDARNTIRSVSSGLNCSEVLSYQTVRTAREGAKLELQMGSDHSALASSNRTCLLFGLRFLGGIHCCGRRGRVVKGGFNNQKHVFNYHNCG
jgi:hypothetical protein